MNFSCNSPPDGVTGSGQWDRQRLLLGRWKIFHWKFCISEWHTLTFSTSTATPKSRSRPRRRRTAGRRRRSCSWRRRTCWKREKSCCAWPWQAFEMYWDFLLFAATFCGVLCQAKDKRFNPYKIKFWHIKFIIKELVFCWKCMNSIFSMKW